MIEYQSIPSYIFVAAKIEPEGDSAAPALHTESKMRKSKIGRKHKASHPTFLARFDRPQSFVGVGCSMRTLKGYCFTVFATCVCECVLDTQQTEVRNQENFFVQEINVMWDADWKMMLQEGYAVKGPLKIWILLVNNYEGRSKEIETNRHTGPQQRQYEHPQHLYIR